MQAEPSPASLQAIPPPGSVVGSRFRVEDEIGRGGMGVVLRGRDDANRPVAIKVLLPEAVEHAEAVARFVNEARAARELTSEHAVRVIDAGTLDTGLPFMVMELLEGQDLATQLEKGGPFTVSDACDAVIDSCDALAEAHARGMVHRDLKPANLFAARGPDGRVRVKVLDFGVSKVAAQIRQVNLTSTGTALGTPYYMAPEQLKSAKGVDGRADIWSLGVVLYELLTGQVPFDGRSFGMLFMQIVSEDPKPLNVVRPDVPPGLAEIVACCMKKNREDRYADLASLVTALARFASPSGQTQARRIAEGRGAPQAPRESSPDLAPPSNPAPQKFKGTMVMANAPAAMAAVRAARASQPDFSAPVPANEGTLAMPQASPHPSTPNIAAANMMAPAPHDSGRFSMPMNHIQTPQGMLAPGAPQGIAVAAPVPAKGMSNTVIIAIVAVFGVLLAIGIALAVMSMRR